MKKKIAILGTALMITAAVTACGGKDAKTTTTTTTTVPVETAVPAETLAPAETKAPETAATEAAIDTESGSLGQEPSQERAALSKEEMKTFAKRVQAAVADKDLKALSGLCAYPLYVSLGENEEEDVKNSDDFMKLKADQIFTDGMMKEVADTDLDSLEQFGAGVILGVENSIAFNNVDGKAAVTSIILQ